MLTHGKQRISMAELHPTQRDKAPAFLKFLDPYQCPYGLTYSDRIQHGNMWGGACF